MLAVRYAPCKQRGQRRPINAALGITRRVLILAATLLLGGCATYRIEALDGRFPPNAAQPNVVKENTLPEGRHCFEPLLHFLSIGIIPTHCVETYSIEFSEPTVSSLKVEVTSMQGWIALFLAATPGWTLGYADNVESKIITTLQTKTQ